MKRQTKTHIPGIKAKGRQELIRHLEGERLTPKQAIIANCYECMGGYTDGKYSCEIPKCSLLPFMPYRDVEK
jgi:hypothetical protein